MRECASHTNTHRSGAEEDAQGSIATLQREIASLQDELKVYRSNEWHPTTVVSMAPRTAGEFGHQQARLTWQSHGEFTFKGIFVVFNRFQQVRGKPREAGWASRNPRRERARENRARQDGQAGTHEVSGPGKTA